MINKPKKHSQSFLLATVRVRRFFAKLPQNVLLRYNVWVEMSFVALGGLIAMVILLSFIFNESFGRREQSEEYVRPIALAADRIKSLNAWIDEREAKREDSRSILSRRLFP